MHLIQLQASIYLTPLMVTCKSYLVDITVGFVLRSVSIFNSRRRVDSIESPVFVARLAIDKEGVPGLRKLFIR
jgi:hypothetical protein